eukprot:jgi/Mesvir1/8670/Mv02610-RA.1
MEVVEYDRRKSEGFRGGGRGGGGRRRTSAGDIEGGPQRRRPDGGSTFEEKLPTFVVRLGDQATSGGAAVEEQLEGLCRALRRDSAVCTPQLVETILDCVTELPTKTPIYGTLVGLINLDNYGFVNTIVLRTAEAFQAALNAGHQRRVRLLLRFITQLAHSCVVEMEAVVALVKQLMHAAHQTLELHSDAVMWQLQADFYVLCVVGLLPWAAAEMGEQMPTEFAAIWSSLETYMSRRRVLTYPALVVVKLEDAGASSNNQDYLSDLWVRAQAFKKRGDWILSSVPRVHLAFSEKFETSAKHALPPTVVPFGALPPDSYPPEARLPSATAGGDADMPAALDATATNIRLFELYGMRPMFRIMPVDMTEQGFEPIERFIVEDYISDVLDTYNGSRKECVNALVSLPFPHRYEFLLSECLYGEMLRLPSPAFKPVYYTVILVEICKVIPTVFPPVLLQTVDLLFKALPRVDGECRTRLALWLAHHMSNFSHMWPWKEWADALERPVWSPHVQFVWQVLQRNVRLSYHARIKTNLPPFLHNLLGPDPAKPNFKYAGHVGGAPGPAGAVAAAPLDAGALPLAAAARELLSMIHQKKLARDVNMWLDEKVLPSLGAESALEVLAQTFLHYGAKTFTHTVTVFERFQPVMERLLQSEAAQIKLLELVADFWCNSAQWMAFVIDRLMTMRMVSNTAIVRWCFLPRQAALVHTTDTVWEVLSNALNKTMARTTDLRAERARAAAAIPDVAARAAAARETVTAAEAEVAAHPRGTGDVEAEEAALQAVAKKEELEAEAKGAEEALEGVHEALEVKEVLLARAIREQEELFTVLFERFATTLSERVTEMEKDADASGSSAAAAGAKGSGGTDASGSAAMDVDTEGAAAASATAAAGGAASKGPAWSQRELRKKEEVEWMNCSLSYLTAFARKYFKEVSPLVERLQAQVFTPSVHPRVLEAAMRGFHCYQPVRNPAQPAA